MSVTLLMEMKPIACDGPGEVGTKEWSGVHGDRGSIPAIAPPHKLYFVTYDLLLV